MFFEKLFEDEEKLYNMFSMDKEHINELIKEWNIIWWHTENHVILSKYSDEILENEIILSNKKAPKCRLTPQQSCEVFNLGIN